MDREKPKEMGILPVCATVLIAALLALSGCNAIATSPSSAGTASGAVSSSAGTSSASDHSSVSYMLDSNGGIAPCAIQTSSIDELNAFAADNGYSMGSHDAGEYRQYAVRSWNADDQLSVYTDKEGAIAYIEKTADVADASAAMAYARQYVSMTDPVELHTTVNGVDAATIIATCTIGDEEGIARCVYAGSTPEKIEVMTFRYAKVSGTASKLIGQPAKECTDAHALADAMVNYLIDNGGYVVRG